MNFEKFPSIEQFRNVIRNVKSAAQYVGQDQNDDPIYDPLKPLPTLKFEGTVKTDGTNFAIGYNRADDIFWFQSRERIITPEQDNAGAARLFHDKDLSFIKEIPGDLIYVFGEFIGKGIMKRTGVAELEKRVIVFDVLSDGEWLSRVEVAKIKNEEIGIYNIYDFPIYEIEIDFSRPDESQNKLIEITAAVEDHCPVAARFGIDGIGEGVVWRCVTPGWESSKYWHKVKGEKHSQSNVKILSPVDDDKNAALREIAEKVASNGRCEQMLIEACGLNNGGQIDRKHLGNYLKMVAADIIKEDSDLMKGYEIKEVMKFAAQRAREYFFAREKEN